MSTKNTSARRTGDAQAATSSDVVPMVTNPEPSLRTSSRVRTVDSRVAAMLPSFKSSVGQAVQAAPQGPLRAARMGGRAGSRKEQEPDYQPSSSEDDEVPDEDDDEEEALLEQRRRSNAEASTNPGQR